MGSVLLPALLLVLAAVPGPAQTPEYAMTVLDHQLPAELKIGQPAKVPLTIRNDGSSTWSSEELFFVSYHWLHENGDTADWEGQRTPFPDPVEPGATSTLPVTVVPPRQPGTYALQWDVVREHVCWFSDKDPTPAPRIPVLVKLDVSHAFSVVSRQIPSWMTTGSVYQAEVTIKNDGTISWQPGLPINLAYHWRSSSGEDLVFEGRRTPIPSAVAPGETVSLSMLIEAPRSAGRHRLQLDMVHEGVCWFAQRDPSPEPGIPVWVIPSAGASPSWLTLLSVLLLAATICVLRWAEQPWLLGLVSLADLMWAGLSLQLKQNYVLSVANRVAKPGCLWVTAAGVILVLLVLLALPRRARPWCAWAAAAMGAFVIFADVIYLRYFDDVISVAIFDAAGQTGQVQESIVSLTAAPDWWLAIDLLVGLVLVWLVARVQRRVSWRPRALAALVLLPLAVPGIFIGATIFTDEQGTFVQVFHKLNVVQKLGVLNFHVYDSVGALHRTLLKPPLSDEQLAGAEQWFREQAPRRAGSGPWFGVAEGMNLLMIQVESLQGYLIGFEINGQEVTPNLNRWLPGVVYFPRVFDQAAQGRSSDCELASQTSLLPLPHGSAAFQYPSNDYTGIAEILAEQGYTTLSAVPFEGSFWNRRLTHPAYGYEQSLFDTAFAPGERIGWGLNDRDFLAQMVPKLAALPEPFCAWMITLSLHHPFEGFPEHHKTLDVGDWEGQPLGNYLHTMHFMDSALGPFIDGLAEAGLLDHTVIALWGDHGSGIFWRFQSKILGRPQTKPDYFDTERVPFLIRVPGEQAPRGTITVNAGQIDFAPTLLSLLGIDPAPWPLMGQNLLGDHGDVPVLCRYGVWHDDEYFYANHGPLLEEGFCYAADTLKPVPVEQCAEGDRRARRRAEVAGLVFSYDLQQRLRELLRADAASAGSGISGGS